MTDPANALQDSPAPPLRGQLRPILGSAVLMLIVTGVLYPLLTTAVAQAIFSHQARGSIVENGGRAVGSELIGQHFTRPEYFHGRPSTTLGPDPADPTKTVDSPYDARLSGASNQGVLSARLKAAVAERAQRYRADNGLPPDVAVPVDAVTASASGLDPDISVANARLQLQRIAGARRASRQALEALLAQAVSGRQLGLLGEPRVNVLQLNLALDAAFPIERTTR